MANTFLSLSDTPTSYFGHNNKALVVNSAADGVNFVNLTLEVLKDTQLTSGYAPQGGQVLTYSSAAGVWRPADNDPYSSGNGLNKSGLTLNVVAPVQGGLLSNATGVYIQTISNVAGSYGSDTSIPAFTVNDKGQITSITEYTANAQFAYNLIADHVQSVKGTPGQITVTGGTGNGANAVVNLVATGVTSATYGSNTMIPQITVDTYGRITNVDLVEAITANMIGAGGNVDYNLITTTAYRDIEISGMPIAQTALSADQKHDTLRIEASNGVSIFTDAAADKLTFAANTDFIFDSITGSITLDDINGVDTTGATDGQVLIYNGSNDSFEPGNIINGAYSGDSAPIGATEGTLWFDQVDGRLYVYYSGVWVDAAPALSGDGGATVTTSDIPPSLASDGDMWFDQVSGRLFVYNQSYWLDAAPTTSFDLENITTSLIPSENVTYDLGTPVRQWRSLYVSSNTIYMGGTPVSVNDGKLSVSDSDVLATEAYVTEKVNTVRESNAASRTTLSTVFDSLGSGASAINVVPGFKGYNLYKIITSHAAEIRFYVSAETAAADASRATGNPIPAGAGVIAEVVTSGAESVLITPGAVGFNDDNPVSSNIYISATNLGVGTQTISVNFVAVETEV